jgi:hypothetical protein
MLIFKYSYHLLLVAKFCWPIFRGVLSAFSGKMLGGDTGKQEVQKTMGDGKREFKMYGEIQEHGRREMGRDDGRCYKCQYYSIVISAILHRSIAGITYRSFRCNFLATSGWSFLKKHLAINRNFGSLHTLAIGQLAFCWERGNVRRRQQCFAFPTPIPMFISRRFAISV